MIVRPSTWTLRRRLVLGILGLLAAASVIVGLVSVLALRGFLMDRLDAQLASATGRTQLATNGQMGDAPAPDVPGGGFATLRFGVQGPYTVTGVVVGEAARAGVVTESGDIQFLDEERSNALLAVPSTGEPVTVDLGGELGEYRAAGDELPGGVVVVTALPLSDVDDTVSQLVWVVIAVALAVLAAAALAGRAVVRLALRPLERVAATASAVADLPLARGEVDLAHRVGAADADPATEVGRVGAAFNRMLDHVASALAARQESENKVRRFVADASHELRTPLASIRGYAELTRRAGHDLPDDVVHSLGRVESEAVRMTSLVEDLLLLARLDEGRDLERREVDLSRLLIDAVSDATVAGPDHVWSLDLPEEPVAVTGDDGRLRQVVANLLANARTHTPAGTEVTVGLAVESDAAVITVADDGPGIAEDLAPRLFERFARGDSSRSRTAGSTGLGLAIVRAVVEGHGGTVVVESVPGSTVFTVRLPRE
ncbi:HAMP domain-containing histidine kinase [Salinibacterium sp. SYSU T00001]|uniref:sensor histidine kinase n=1 Tax=Homoserinimonas sedimenticola TaxID=2986805 RepID=UPI0022368D4A|nr:HAMP domain-containing sensor histidine kinase [Salinibacterium sedimenticola]MCW4385241.1 HAMP domain-containing histidine kinase [Salinibacterium sedimenticola]